MDKPSTSGDKRCGFVAVVGAPNAGKSTLTNRLVGCKVSIVTHKAQTTRRRILGIAYSGVTQIVLMDTPGVFKPHKALDKAMVSAALQGLREADIGLVLVDAAKKDAIASTAALLADFSSPLPPLILVINKIDRLPKEQLLALSAALNKHYAFEQTFMISALTGAGVEDLRAFLGASLPKSSWHFPEDQASNLTERELAAEVVREKLFLFLHQELPYHLTVDTEAWKELKDGSIRLTMVIYVDRPSHKPIVIGERGEKIKTIGKLARTELIKMFEREVHLFLYVKVKEKWTEHPERYAELGLLFGD